MCRHQWGEPLYVFTPPVDREIEGRGPDALYVAERTIWGFTVVTQRCTKCGRVRSYHVTGRVTPDPNEESQR